MDAFAVLEVHYALRPVNGDDEHVVVIVKIDPDDLQAPCGRGLLHYAVKFLFIHVLKTKNGNLTAPFLFTDANIGTIFEKRKIYRNFAPMKYSATELASLLGGTVEGDPGATVSSFSKIETGKEGQLCFFANPKYEKYVYSSKASVILVNKDFEPRQSVSATLVRVDNAYEAISKLLKIVSDSRRQYRRSRSLSARIGWGTKIGRKVSIGEFVRIGKHCTIGECTIIHDSVSIGEGSQIGCRCIIYPGVRIYPGSIIGDGVILHSNCVIGSDGFGNVPLPDGSWQKIEHLGNVKIGDNCEIGACTTIDRAEMGSTIIGRGVKIDNLCQIAHNVEIGDNTAIAALAGIAGSTKIGKNCIIAGQAGIIGHLNIADGTTICAQAGVIGNVRKSGEVLFGTPAIDRLHFLRSYAAFKAQGEKK